MDDVMVRRREIIAEQNNAFARALQVDQRNAQAAAFASELFKKTAATAVFGTNAENELALSTFSEKALAHALLGITHSVKGAEPPGVIGNYINTVVLDAKCEPPQWLLRQVENVPPTFKISRIWYTIGELAQAASDCGAELRAHLAGLRVRRLGITTSAYTGPISVFETLRGAWFAFQGTEADAKARKAIDVFPVTTPIRTTQIDWCPSRKVAATRKTRRVCFAIQNGTTKLHARRRVHTNP